MKKKLFLVSLCLASMVLGALLFQFILNPQSIQAAGPTRYKCLPLQEKDIPKMEELLNIASKDGWEFVQSGEGGIYYILIFKKN